MLIGGEKWACEACVRGHRVSNCQHSDRPLQHINKKGRPVSQCQHCRSLRKSRSAHVRCDCSSEKLPNKGVCLQDAATKTRNCACRRGSRCTCALKKESLDPVLESDSDEPPSLREKRRVRSQPIGLENSLTIFTNGYHKPAQKHNNTAQKYGSPYPAPRSQSYRSLSSSRNFTQNSDYPAYPIKIDSDSVIKEPSTRTQLEHSLPESNQTSPVSSPSSSLDLLGGQHSTLSIFMPGELNWPQSLEDLPSAPDAESSIFSVGLNSASIKWSPYDGPAFNEGFPAPSFRQTSSYAGFEHGILEQPPLTSTPTSGELSEVDEFAQLSDRNNGKSGVHNSCYGSDQETSDYSGDLDNYRISSAASLITPPQTHPPTNNGHLDELESFLKYSNNLNNLSHALPISTDDGKKTNQGSSPFHENNFGFFTAEDESETLWINNLSPSSNTMRTASMQNSLIDSFWIQ
ncbi:hypothetical protein Golomagni_05750 [Golovinomyces magnicellulatus]|nr:hypothetical protein Golomagni_05750 [Golovinomyces magnicellulatus]